MFDLQLFVGIPLDDAALKEHPLLPFLQLKVIEIEGKPHLAKKIDEPLHGDQLRDLEENFSSLLGRLGCAPHSPQLLSFVPEQEHLHR